MLSESNSKPLRSRSPLNLAPLAPHFGIAGDFHVFLTTFFIHHPDTLSMLLAEFAACSFLIH